MQDPHSRKPKKPRDAEPLEEVEDTLEEVEDDSDSSPRASRSGSRRSRHDDEPRSRGERPARARDRDRRPPPPRRSRSAGGGGRGGLAISAGIVAVLLVVVGIAAGVIFLLRHEPSAARIPEKDWTAFRPKPGGCSILMPGQPAESHERLPYYGLDLVKHICDRTNDKSAFMLAFVEVPPNLSNDPNLDLWMDGYSRVAARNLDGEIVDEKNIKLGTHKGCEVQIVTGKHKGMCIIRFYQVSFGPFRRIYVLSAAGDYIKPDKGDAARFFDSFQVDAPPAPAAPANPPADKPRPGKPPVAADPPPLRPVTPKPNPLDPERPPSDIPAAVWKRLLAAREGPFQKPKRGAVTASTLYLVSCPGDFIGEGKNYAYAGQDLVVKPFRQGIRINIATWVCNFFPPRGLTLSEMEYDNVGRGPGVGIAGLDVSGNGHGSNRTIGQFVVWELEMSGNTITRLAIDFVQHSEVANRPPLLGSIRYNSSFQ